MRPRDIAARIARNIHSDSGTVCPSRSETPTNIAVDYPDGTRIVWQKIGSDDVKFLSAIPQKMTICKPSGMPNNQWNKKLKNIKQGRYKQPLPTVIIEGITRVQIIPD